MRIGYWSDCLRRRICVPGSPQDKKAKAGGTKTVMLYSSMQEDQLNAIKQAFEKKYPDIKMDYYFAGTGKVITKIATEAKSGQVAADVIWVGDPADYIGFKKLGILENMNLLKQRILKRYLLIRRVIIPVPV